LALAIRVPEVQNGRLRAGPARAQAQSAQADGDVVVLVAPAAEAGVVAVDRLELGPGDAKEESEGASERDEFGEAGAPRPAAVARRQRVRGGNLASFAQRPSTQRPAVDGQSLPEHACGQRLGEHQAPGAEKPAGTSRARDCAHQSLPGDAVAVLEDKHISLCRSSSSVSHERDSGAIFWLS